MATQAPVADRILGVVKRTHGCDLDTLAESVPELTWNQVFLEIDRLSREGQILVTCETRGSLSDPVAGAPEGAEDSSRRALMKVRQARARSLSSGKWRSLPPQRGQRGKGG